MTDVFVVTMVAGLGGLVVGAVVGCLATALTATGKISDIMEQMADAQKRADEWHKNWRKVNNYLDSVRQACRKVYVPKRGKGGKIVGKMPVWDLIEKITRDV